MSECRRIENKKTPDVKIVDRLFYVKSRKHITKNLCSINAHLGQAKHARTFRFREKSLQKIRLDPELIVREDNGAIKPI